MSPDCIFCKIVAGEIPAEIVYRDDYVTAFHDIRPAMPVHVLIVPNQHLDSLAALEDEHAATVGHVLTAAHKVATQAGVAARGYRLSINMGRDANLVVHHLHAHLMGGRRMGWPPG